MPKRIAPAFNRHLCPRTLALAVAAGIASASAGQVNPVYLQWWENRWVDMEHRTPDFFMAGYGALWLPPVHKAASVASVGYDPFDRFDLGRPGAPTAYGTEQEFRAVLAELQQANGLVAVDIVMNHNSGRTTDGNFWRSGGYPGFWGNPPLTGNKLASDNWGDFNNGTGCCTFFQSENPGGANYNLLTGDLVALIDIAQQSNNVFIRHPVAAGNPQNIPAGTVWNQPNPLNAMLYPDLQLPSVTFTNPALNIPGASPPRTKAASNVTVFPFNTTNPMAGDPVAENATALLVRWTQWMLDVYKVDAFRIDAIKHTPNWFFDSFWDNAVYQRRTTPWGAKVTPFSFGECVEGNTFTLQNFVRKDGFGNRDALDLNGAGQLRNLINSGGLGNWSNVVSAHLDNADDGFNNGTLGVNHVFSHDNGSVGNGSSQPSLPTYQQQGFAQNAYMIMRTGVPLVYHNARGINRPGGFWPREGSPLALGVDPFTNTLDQRMVRVVQLSNMYGRGDFRPLNANTNDTLVFERFRNNAGVFSANVIVGVNDSYSNGVDSATVTSSFPQGTILVEQTGNADDPTVDPTNIIPRVVTVGAGGSVTINVPRNQNVNGTQHHKGYVIYGPAVPNATLAITPVASTIPADTTSTPLPLRRTTTVPVVTSATFDIDITTSQAQPGDNGTDDNAVFRIDQGFRDFNGNGSVDWPPTNAINPGFENFLTRNEPMFGTARLNGRYTQTINTSLLSEGYHYITAYVFRNRPANTDPLFRELRQVIYVDRQPPSVALTQPPQPITTTSFDFQVFAQDRTANSVFMFANLAPGTDPIPLCTPLTAARRIDRFEWKSVLSGLFTGTNRITIVAFEDSGNVRVQTETVQVALPCYANCDNSTVVPVLNALDFSCFLQRYNQALALPANQQASSYANCDGSLTPPVLNALDFSCFLVNYQGGCP